MIIKKREKPYEIKVLEALLARLKNNHPAIQAIKKDLARRQKGYTGELKVDYFLESLAHEATILQDVSLEVAGKTVQIDTLVITSFSIYCIEIKNIDGTILFNTTFRQFIQKNGNEHRAFRYPLNQVENHRLQLARWLQNNQFKHVPISYLIVISEPSTIIEVEGDEAEIADIVIHAEFLPRKIRKTDKKLQKRNHRPIPHRQIGQRILNDTKPKHRNLLQQFNLHRRDLLNGVQCPFCWTLSMYWSRRSWQCRHCKNRSNTAHHKALRDYFLLIQPTITNKEARKFLNIDCRHRVYKLLSNANLKFIKSQQVWKPQEQ